MRLIEKLVLVFLAVSLVPLFLVGSLVYNNTRSLYIEQIFNQLDAGATLQDHRLSDLHNQNIERINTFTSRLPILELVNNYNETKSKAAQQQLNDSFKQSLAALPDFARISVLDPNGITIASSDPQLINYDQSQSELYKTGKAGKTQVDLIGLDSNGQLHRQMSGPLEFNSKIIGVAIVETNVDYFLNLARDYTGLGDSGETVFAQRTPDGRAVFTSPLRFKPEAALRDEVASNLPMTEALGGIERRFTESVDYRGKQIFAVSRYVENSNQGIIVKIDKDEALQPINHLRDTMLLTAFMTSVVVVFVALSIARRISDPILQIDEVAEEVSRGNLSQRVVVSTKDEISNLAATFNDMLDNLEATDKIKTDFVSLASHQLRTPATGVKAIISTLLEGYAGDLTHKQREYLEQAFETNERQLSVVNDLLSVAVIDSGNLELNKENVIAQELVGGIIHELLSLAKSRNQQLELRAPHNNIIVSVDLEKMRMVVDNLISNASKYTPAGGKILVSITATKKKVTIAVIDNGVGMSAEDQTKLFHKFSQIDNHANAGHKKTFSAGLGLYLAKNIVELHGGKIRVESAVNKGSTFSIELPTEGK